MKTCINATTLVLFVAAALAPLPLPKAHCIISVWKGGYVRLDPQNKQNEMGGLSANNLAVEAGAYSDFTQMVPGGNPSDVSRYFLNT